MRTPVTPQFRAEVERFHLRFTCESCVHFEPERRACANGYPNGAHLEPNLESCESLEFCKEFELV